MPPIETRPIALGDDDLLVVTCKIDNKSHSGSAVATIDGLKVIGLVLAALGSGEQLGEKLKFKMPGGAVVEQLILGGAVIGAVVAVVAEIVSDFGEDLGILEPDCDGTVFGIENALQLHGGGLMDAFEAGGARLGQPFPLISLTDDRQVVPDKCGHPPSTTVNFSATITSFEPDVPNFAGSPGAPKSWRPMVGQPRSDWTGVWGDGGSVEGSAVRCTISVPPDSFAPMQAAGGSVARGPQTINIAVEEHLDEPGGRVIFASTMSAVSGPVPAGDFRDNQPPIDTTHIFPVTTNSAVSAKIGIAAAQVASAPLAASAGSQPQVTQREPREPRRRGESRHATHHDDAP